MAINVVLFVALLCSVATMCVAQQGAGKAAGEWLPSNGRVTPGPVTIDTTSAEFKAMVKNTHDLFNKNSLNKDVSPKRKLSAYSVPSECNTCGFNKVNPPRLTTDITERAVVLITINQVNSAGATRRISCSGTLIDSQTVLTAGHCVVAGGGGAAGYRFTSATVYFRVVNNVAGATASACGYAYYLGFRDSNNRSYDIAILRLCSPFSGTTPIGYRISSSEGACLLRKSARALGYPQGYLASNNAMFAATGIGASFVPAPFCSTGQNMVLSSTDIYPGMSGGPLMLLETPVIIAVNSYTCSTCPNGFTPIFSDSLPGLYSVFGLTAPAPQ